MKIVAVTTFAVALASLVACASSNDSSVASSGQDVSASSSAAWRPLMDDCVQTAVGAAASEAFKDSNLQHLEAVAVDGDLAVDGTLTITVTTGNDEDGDTTRKVEVAQKVNTTSGAITCTVIHIDGKATTAHADASALSQIVDPCTGVAIVAANKLSDNYWHLYGITLDGDPAVSGELKYVVTDGNDEDGETDFNVTVKQSINTSTGHSTCTVTSATEAPR